MSTDTGITMTTELMITDMMTTEPMLETSTMERTTDTVQDVTFETTLPSRRPVLWNLLLRQH